MAAGRASLFHLAKVKRCLVSVNTAMNACEAAGRWQEVLSLFTFAASQRFAPLPEDHWWGVVYFGFKWIEFCQRIGAQNVFFFFVWFFHTLYVPPFFRVFFLLPYIWSLVFVVVRIQALDVYTFSITLSALLTAGEPISWVLQEMARRRTVLSKKFSGEVVGSQGPVFYWFYFCFHFCWFLKCF